MARGHNVSCVLCQRSEETKITGALSTKDRVTAHQNCLLFSSGIFCRDSPQFDDLFGFSVEDVMTEVKRGNKLTCDKCKKKGATAGCEVKRCKKSYHYPCAVTAGAKSIEDVGKEYFGLYCLKHYQQKQEKDNNVNGHASSFSKAKTSENPSEAGPSKVHCLVCEKKEGNIALESLSNSSALLCCDKHAPASRKKNPSGDSSAAGPSACSSDSNSSSSKKNSSFKRRLSFKDKQGEIASKRKPEAWTRMLPEDSSDSDVNEPDADLEIFAPLESDIEGSVNLVPESQTVPQLNRNVPESPTRCTSGNQPALESKDVNNDDETDVDSESLLPLVASSVNFQSNSTANAALTVSESSPEQSRVHSPEQLTPGPSVPQQSSTRPSPSPDHFKPRGITDSPPCTSSAISPAPPELVCVSLISSPDSPAAPPSEPQPGIDSASFWKSCNAAGCTQAIFADFTNALNDIAGRIQADQASQEDYDLALTVMEASGKLAELVTKQQKELQRKQMELVKAAAAMKEVVAALKR